MFIRRSLGAVLLAIAMLPPPLIGSAAGQSPDSFENYIQRDGLMIDEETPQGLSDPIQNENTLELPSDSLASANSGNQTPPIERYGEAPPDRTPQFLRTVTPLLASGQWQFDYGFTYALQERDFPVVAAPVPGGSATGGPATVVRQDVRRRSFFVPLAVRYGYDEQTQLFANLPVGWSDTELANPFEDQSESRAGIGDLNFGATRLLCQNRCDGSSWIGTVRATAPTGEAINPLLLTSAGLGNGVWRLGFDLLKVQTFDPIVLFYGVGYTHSFEDDFDGFDVQLGDQYSYNIGVGFAASEKVTLSTALIGSYIDETQFNGNRLAGTDQEPVRLRMAATIAHRCKLVEPFVNFGLTQTAPSFELGVVWTR